MSDWRAFLKSDPTIWLLEEDNPSVRYFTLKDILDMSEEDAEVQKAKKNIMCTGFVPKILEMQQSPEYIKNYPKFYTSKYKGLVWQLLVLAELGAECNEQIKEQCEYLLDNAQEIEEGGFAMHVAAKTGGGRKTEVIPCLTGNMVWSLIHFGYLNDPRLQKAIEWLSGYMRLNDGVENDPQVPPYNRYDICWGKHTCLMGVVKAVKGLGAIPKLQRTFEIQETLDQCVEFILIHHIYKRSHDLSKKAKPGWSRFSFPLMYQTDILEILDILTALGIKDNRMDDALDIVVSKQNAMGRWQLMNTTNTDRLLLPFEKKGEQSKWLTMRAIRVIKKMNED